MLQRAPKSSKELQIETVFRLGLAGNKCLAAESKLEYLSEGKKTFEIWRLVGRKNDHPKNMCMPTQHLPP